MSSDVCGLWFQQLEQVFHLGQLSLCSSEVGAVVRVHLGWASSSGCEPGERGKKGFRG